MGTHQKALILQGLLEIYSYLLSPAPRQMAFLLGQLKYSALSPRRKVWNLDYRLPHGSRNYNLRTGYW